MLPITLGDTSFKYGPWEIPYANVSGAGVAVQQRRFAVYRSLVIGYRLPGDEKHRKILFRLTPGPQEQRLVEAFRAHVADRWKGEGGLFEMNKRLGFSNSVSLGIVAGIVLVTVAVVVGWAVTLKHPEAPPSRPNPSSQTPRR